MSPLFYAHSGLRYLVLLAGVATLGYAAFGLVTRRPVGRPMRILASVFVGSLDLQILLGIALLFSGGFGAGVAGHFLPVVFAAAVAHVVFSVMRRRPPEKRSFAPYLVAALISLTLIVLGVLALGRPIVG